MNTNGPSEVMISTSSTRLSPEPGHMARLGLSIGLPIVVDYDQNVPYSGRTIQSGTPEWRNLVEKWVASGAI